MAGPWFKVYLSGDEEWATLETIWISNGDKTNIAKVQGRVTFCEPNELLSENTPVRVVPEHH